MNAPAEKPRLTAMVLTFNESEMISLCLGRLTFADEILVIDSFSHDDTRELAEAAGARVLTHKFKNFSDQCNWGMAQAAGDWILMVDADELVEPDLARAASAAVESASGPDIYSVRRDSYVFGRMMRSSAWSNEWVPRLFRKGAITYTGEVHPDPQLNGRPVGKLGGKMLHYPYRDTRKYFDKFQLYSTLWAEKAHAAGRRTSLPLALVSGAWRVFHDYFVRGGILDGRVGFLLAVLGGMHTFIRHIKLWGMQHAKEIGRVYEKEAAALTGDSHGAERGGQDGSGRDGAPQP